MLDSTHLEKILHDVEGLFSVAIILGCILAGLAVSRAVSVVLYKISIREFGDKEPRVRKAFVGLPALWGIPAGGFLALQIAKIPPGPFHVLESLFEFLAFFFLTVMGARFISAILSFKLQKTVGSFAATSILIDIIELVVFFTGFMMMLHSFGAFITPMLTALGVGGLAVALALQDTLTNLFAGLNILMSNQTKVGDYIKLQTGEEGSVADMNWRSTAIRQNSDNMLVVPYHLIATSTITNFALPKTECSIIVPVGVGYESDLDQVEKNTIEVAQEVLNDTAGAVSDFAPYIRYNAFGDSSINFNVYLRISNVVDQPLIRHEFIKRLHVRYRQEGIDIPFPVRTIKIERVPH